MIHYYINTRYLPTATLVTLCNILNRYYPMVIIHNLTVSIIQYNHNAPIELYMFAEENLFNNYTYTPIEISPNDFIDFFNVYKEKDNFLILLKLKQLSKKYGVILY